MNAYCKKSKTYRKQNQEWKPKQGKKGNKRIARMFSSKETRNEARIWQDSKQSEPKLNE